jgi:hypothetical protein
MNESDLELLVSQFLDGIRRAFRDVGRKGAAEYAIVMQQLNRAIFEADKIKREQLPSQEEIAESKGFDDRLQEHIEKTREKTGSLSKEQVLKQIHSSPVTMKLVAARNYALVERGLSAHVSNLIERAKRTPEPDDERQTYFDFHKISEFRSVPKKLVFTDADTGKWRSVLFVEALAEDRKAYIAQCKKTIERQEEDRERVAAADELLQPLVKKYGDLPGPQLWARKLQDEKKDGRTG